MAALKDICVSAVINLLSVFAFLVAFAFLRLQPVNDRVYFSKWYLKGLRSSPRSSGSSVRRFINLDAGTYVKFLNWMPAALKMPEPELVDHAGLDSAVYIRIYLLGLKLFVPISIFALMVLVPVNSSSKTLEGIEDLTYSDIDKLSISNVPEGSNRFFAHIAMSYVFTFWTLYVLYIEYKRITAMRLRFLAHEKRRPDQFTVLVRNIPPDPDESISEHIEHFFCVNHPHHYLSHQLVYNTNKLAHVVEKKAKLQSWYTYYQTKYQNSSMKPITKTGLWGLFGTSVDALDHCTLEIQKLIIQETIERDKIMNDSRTIVPAAFVSFKSRWGAAVCAQTQQSSNPFIWLTEWAPEPRDVYWDNLSIPYVELTLRRFLMGVALFSLTVFFMIPVAFVQSLANIEGIVKVLPFMRHVIESEYVKSVIQGFLPGIALKIFLLVLPYILMAMSKIEGFTSLSSLDRKSASKYYIFMVVNLFLGSIITGTAFQQLKVFLNQGPTQIPRTVGVSIPMKATFFITYVMVDGWSAVAADILRLVPLVTFYIKSAFLAKTEHDTQKAMDPRRWEFAEYEPQLQFYFLLGLVYSAVTPILLPFIVIFFAFSFTVYRHQVINVYDQRYESGAAFWPDVHQRLIIDLLISQFLLIGLLSTKMIARSTPLLLPLPILTIWFHIYCKERFESAFVKYPLQDAMVKDTLERATEPKLNLKLYLHNAYIHPAFQGTTLDSKLVEKTDDEEQTSSTIVATKRNRMDSSDSLSDAGSIDIAKSSFSTRSFSSNFSGHKP